MFKKNIGDNMKIKDFSATKLFSKQFETIFGKETTFGDIAKVKAKQETSKVRVGWNLLPKEQRNSTENLMGSHVEQHLKDQQEYKTKLIKEKL